MLFRNLTSKKYLKICTGLEGQKELTIIQNCFTDNVHRESGTLPRATLWRSFQYQRNQNTETRVTVQIFNNIVFSFIAQETKNWKQIA